jgi:PST family polysaccharide transporter
VSTPHRISVVLRNRIVQNAAALYASQFLLTALPLLTLPWMARALGPSELGSVLYVQSFAFLLVNLTEYGFRLSATRDIARARDDRERTATIVAGVFGAKLVLAAAISVVALVALVFVPRFREDPVLLLFGWGMGLLQGLEPMWYFIGVERLRLTAGRDAAIRLLTAVAIIVFVRHPGQGRLVLAIWTAGAGVATLLLLVIMYRAVPLRRPSLSTALETLRSGWSLFVTTAAVSLYTTATVLLLGFVVSNAQLALFASAERIVRASLRALSPVGSAVYPRVAFLLETAREARAQRLSVLALGALTGVGVAMAAALFVLAPVLVDGLFGPAFGPTVGILRTLSLLIPAVAITSALTGPWLLARGLDRIVTRTSIGAGLANVVLALVVGSIAGIRGAAWVLVVIEVGVAASLALAIHRRGLFPTRAQVLEGAAG